ncbi:MAG: undecaprenyl-diphosphatase UppP [Candidatus Omnitrophica bacterium]|nr:undecaprenyl-diphosphatase UppP [Candidatus Omnitrophota bacterium]
MTNVESVVLGVIQGITEFFPISSSGHLIVFPYLLGWQEHPLAFDIMLHFATFFAVLLYFRRDWINILREGFLSIRERRIEGNEHRKLFWCIFLASIPTVIFGSMVAEGAEYYFRNPILVALMLGLFGVILYIAEARGKKNKSLKDITWQIALLIGFAQMFAIIPGVSRAGVTITAAIALGMNRDSSVRFSFLMGAPIIFAAGCYSMMGFAKMGGLLPPAVLIPGLISAFLSSMIAIHFLLRFVKRHSFTPFAVYRVVVSVIIVTALFLKG